MLSECKNRRQFFGSFGFMLWEQCENYLKSHKVFPDDITSLVKLSGDIVLLVSLANKFKDEYATVWGAFVNYNRQKLPCWKTVLQTLRNRRTWFRRRYDISSQLNRRHAIKQPSWRKSLRKKRRVKTRRHK